VNPIGIMQGRLSPRGARPQSFPALTWPQEIEQARACGFDRLEWLVTGESLGHNPLWSPDGPLRLIQRSGLRVASVCADCFITAPIVGVPAANAIDGLALLERIVTCAHRLGAGVVVLPLLEGNAIATGDDAAAVVAALAAPLLHARACGIRVALESDLPAPQLVDLVRSAGSDVLGVCYDTGNAAASGFDAAADLRAIGDRLFHVHIKDRRRNGGSVPLGEGDADFEAVFDGLRAVGYHGPIILETPPGDDPLTSARAHLAFVRGHLAAAVSHS